MKTSLTARFHRSPLGAAVIIAALCVGARASGEPQPHAPTAKPQPAASKRAREEARRAALALHDEARALYQRGAYRAAIAKFEAAAKLDPEGKELIYNLAIIHEKLGEIDTAELYYRRYLEMETEPKARDQVAAVLRRLAGAKKEIVRPAAAHALPPVLLTTPPAPPDKGERTVAPWVVALGGVAAGALVIGNVFAVSALMRDPGSDARTGGDVSVTDLRSDATVAHRDAVIADVALVVAGVAGAAAVCVYVATPRQSPAPQPAATPQPAPPRPFSTGEDVSRGSVPPRGVLGGGRQQATRSPIVQPGTTALVAVSGGSLRLEVLF